MPDLNTPAPAAPNPRPPTSGQSAAPSTPSASGGASAPRMPAPAPRPAPPVPAQAPRPSAPPSVPTPRPAPAVPATPTKPATVPGVASKSASPSVAAPAAPAGEPQIHVIPEKFYGAALKANIANRSPEKSVPAGAGGSSTDGSRARPAWIFPTIIGVVLLLGVAGGFVYFNQNLIFPKQTPPPTQEVPTPPVPEPPVAATNVSATATSPTLVRLSWTDVATDEAAYRIERRDTVNAYAGIRNLAPNETSYDDPTVLPDQDYLYRIVAVNTNGESPSAEVTIRTPMQPAAPPPSPTLPPAGLDSDSDGLTDLEEPLYGSPVRDPDADKDSYNDGNEVFHLYSPSGRAPGRLLESGLVRPLESPSGWSFFVPASWQTQLGSDGRSATVMTGHGETFAASVEQRDSGQTLLDWYLAKNPGVLSSQVRTLRTQSGFDGIEGADQLTAYIEWGSAVFILRYDLDNQPFVNFRTTYEMMKNSLTLETPPAASGTPAVSAPTQEAPAPTGDATGSLGGTQAQGGTPSARDTARLVHMSQAVSAFSVAADEGASLSGCTEGDRLSACVIEDAQSVTLNLAGLFDPSGAADAAPCTSPAASVCNYSIRRASGPGTPLIDDFRIDFWLEVGSQGRGAGSHSATAGGIL